MAKLDSTMLGNVKILLAKGAKGDGVQEVEEEIAKLNANVTELTQDMTEQFTIGMARIDNMIAGASLGGYTIQQHTFNIAESDWQGESPTTGYYEFTISDLPEDSLLLGDIAGYKMPLWSDYEWTDKGVLTRVEITQGTDSVSISGAVWLNDITKVTPEDVDPSAFYPATLIVYIAVPSSGVNTEVEDIRIGYDGTTYPTAGDAVRGQVKDIVSVLKDSNAFNLTQSMNKGQGRSKGVDYTHQSNGDWTVVGTATGASFYPLFQEGDSLPSGIVAGGTYYMSFSSETVRLQVFDFSGSVVGSTLLSMSGEANTKKLIIPETCTGLIVRLYVPTGASVDEVVHPIITDTYTNETITREIQNGLIQFVKNIGEGNYNSCDDIDKNSIVFVSITSGGVVTIADAPISPAWLATYLVGDASISALRFQAIYPYGRSTTKKPLYRSKLLNGTWTEWREFGGASIYNTTTIEKETVNNTYNITTSPVITTDTNGWLQAVDTDTEDETGKTDMTGAIMSMLNDTGYCHLSEGIFYVSGSIDLPDGAMLEGCGNGTVIRLLQSTSSGYCVKAHSKNTIRNIRFSGGYNEFDPATSDIGSRNGIYYTGSSAKPCVIEGCWFENFNGSAIYCYNTGGSVNNALIVTACYIDTCEVGINIDYKTEYSKFSDIVIRKCYYACINNGGNNVFVNCTFHGTIGFLIDNSNGDKPNNTHGSMIGCVLNHIDNWNQSATLGGGDAIKVIGGENGFIFSGCQIWYGFVNIQNSRGVAFSDCLFGDSKQNPHITVTGSYPAFFNGCIFHQQPVLNVVSGTKFDNCYLDSDGTRITA